MKVLTLPATDRATSKPPEGRRIWEQFGAQDPLWYVLSVPGRSLRRWTPEDFFSTGEREIGAILERLSELHVEIDLDVALDFGCGVGRLAQALSRHFQRVDGVDISSSMLATAERFNRYGPLCRYVLNPSEDLSLYSDETF
ncbi:MAG: methyltransferase domain-containing protein, partial [Thermoplasmata archaeon]|nr:methyltransferase domain-containing protein [Thermoplasmata archaeon]